MKNSLKISALLVALACVSGYACEQSCDEQQTIMPGGCVVGEGDIVGTITGLPWRIESFDEAEGRITALIAQDALSKDLVVGDIIGTIGSETCRVESIEPSEVEGYVRVVLNFVAAESK